MSFLFWELMGIIITMTTINIDAFAIVPGTVPSTWLLLTHLNLCSFTLFYLHYPPCCSSNSLLPQDLCIWHSLCTAIPSAWNALPPDTHPHGSLCPGLYSHVTSLERSSLITWAKVAPFLSSPITLVYFSLWHLSHLSYYIIYLFIACHSH